MRHPARLRPNGPYARRTRKRHPPTFGPPGDVGTGRRGGVTNSIIAQGCRLQGGRIERVILSPGVWIEAEAEVVVGAWVRSGQLPLAQATYAILELVLARFVSPDGVHSDDHS